MKLNACYNQILKLFLGIDSNNQLVGLLAHGQLGLKVDALGKLERAKWSKAIKMTKKVGKYRATTFSQVVRVLTLNF